MGYRMYVDTEDREELLCGGKLFGYVPSSSCESYSFLKGHCYFTNQLVELTYLDYGNPCEYRFPGKIIKEFLKLYNEDCKKLEDFEPFDDERIKKLNDDTTYILYWC